MKLPPWSTVVREADGNVSATRVVLLLMAGCILGTWTGRSIAKGQVLDVPAGVRWIFALGCGLKWAQLKHESDRPADDPAHA